MNSRFELPCVIATGPEYSDSEFECEKCGTEHDNVIDRDWCDKLLCDGCNQDLWETYLDFSYEEAKERGLV